jgi:DNA polymerase-3 subunit alpha
MQPRFVHLHLHSEYSLVDSTIRIDALIGRCVELGMPAVAITDQSNLFALVKFYRAAEKAGIKPIVGADVWMEDPELRQPARLTLLCQDQGGYRSLSRLLSRGYQDGHRGDHVVIERDWLCEDASGLIVMAGVGSDVGQCLLEGREDDAGQRLAQWQQHFGDRFYLELTRAGRDAERLFEPAALRLAARLDCPVVASNDARFLEAADFDAHEARVCIATGRVLGDSRRPRDYSPEQFLRSPEEMAALFADLPGALENTVEIARRCTLTLTLGQYVLPEFPVPEGHDANSWIAEESRLGLAQRLDGYRVPRGLTREAYASRLETELGVICRMGFPGYFLIVADFINWAKRNGIPVGPGRGSGAGSLVAWSLRITDIDPLAYGLLFERFLNPERVSMPDFDVDFCTDGRDRVIDYVAEKYGRDHVSQIITYGTMAAKGVIRDCGRVMGLGYGYVDSIAKLIPNVLGIGLNDALGRSRKARENAELVSTELIELYQSKDDVRDLIDLALKLEDLTRNAGKHAGGVVIAPGPLTDYSPLFAEPPSKTEAHRSVVTQFDKDDVEAVGLVKFDFLGLRNLTVIDWTVKAINAEREAAGQDGAPLDITAIPLDDRITYELFSQARTVAVFQFESGGMQRLLKDARPDRFEDLIALVSLYRPGPMELIPSFCKRKHGEEPIEYPDPRVETILKETYGIMVYQEQVMQMAQIVGGYSLGGADLLRRAMGKKKPEEMAKERIRFRDGASGNGLSEAKADEIFDLMEKFAGYGFNKSHAAAYALVSYQTAWLKAHHSAQFMAAVLSSDMDSTDKVFTFLRESRALGLTLLPPDVNASGYHFQAVDPRTLRYGLGAIRGAGENACREIERIRSEDGAFRDLLDFCQRLGPRVNRKVHEALIDAGAVDALGANRATLRAQLPDVLRATEQMTRDREAGQVDLFGSASAEPTPVIPQTAPLPEWSLQERLAREREVLGFYLSGHPVDPVRELVSEAVTCTLDGADAAFEQRRFLRGNDALVLIVGQIVAINQRNADRSFLSIEDGGGRIEATVYADVLQECGELVSRDAIVMLEGQLHEDRFRGGTAMRVRRIWDVGGWIRQHAQRVRLTLDATAPGAAAALQAAVSRWQGGRTPISIEILTPAARGIIDTDEGMKLRAEPELLSALRAIPGASQVRIVMGRSAPTSTSQLRGDVA